MDIRKVKKLIEMLEESNLNEIEIKEGEEAVKLVKRVILLQIILFLLLLLLFQNLLNSLRLLCHRHLRLKQQLLKK